MITIQSSGIQPDPSYILQHITNINLIALMLGDIQTIANDAISSSGGNVVLTGNLSVGGTLTVTGPQFDTSSISVGTDLTFAKQVNHNISVDNSTTSGANGGNLTLSSGLGRTSGNGGSINLLSGSSSANGDGGAINITAGASGPTLGLNGGLIAITSGGSTIGNAGPITILSGLGAADSGPVNLGTGVLSAAGTTGILTIGTGNSAAGGSGAINIATGTSVNTASGTITMASGAANNQASGNITIGSGTSTGNNSGTLTLQTGLVTTGSSGSISLTTGNIASGTSAAGSITLTTGTSLSTTVAPTTTIAKAFVRKPSTKSIATGATLLAIDLIGGYIEVTGATGNLTLPTVATMTTALGTSPAGTWFDVVFNASGMTAANVVTLVLGSNMSTLTTPVITGSSTLTISQSLQGVASFRFMFDSATTVKVSRLV